MKQYKGHPIYGIAIPASEHSWCSRGLVYDQDLTQTIEIKRIELHARSRVTLNNLSTATSPALTSSGSDESLEESNCG